MAQAVSCRPLTAEDRVRSQISPCEICVKVALGQVFLPVPRLTPVSIIPPMPHTHLYPHVAVARMKSGRSLGTLLKSTPVWAIEEH